MVSAINVLALVGIVLSTYSFGVKYSLKNKDYKPGCDINSRISCSRAFNSKYAKTFGISNSLWGAFYYLLIIVVSHFLPSSVLVLAPLGLLASIYLAYISYFRLKTFCLVCTATYLVNIAIFVLALSQHL